MDTSKEYIKMCDCPEVQGKWKIGMDAMAHPATDPHDYAQMILKPHPKHKTQQARITIWLPRQDQIQEMFKWEIVRLVEQLYHFVDYQISYSSRHDYRNSMEQLWFAFYMFENHQKIWDGKKWVKSVKE